MYVYVCMRAFALFELRCQSSCLMQERLRKRKTFKVRACAKKMTLRGREGEREEKKLDANITEKRNKEFVQMHIHRHLCSPSRPSFVASELLTLSSAHLLNQTSRQYPHLDMYVDCETRRRRKKKFINGNNLRSPVQIDFERKNEGENIERASFD